jgi:hypothetical protein
MQETMTEVVDVQSTAYTGYKSFPKTVWFVSRLY